MTKGISRLIVSSLKLMLEKLSELRDGRKKLKGHAKAISSLDLSIRNEHEMRMLTSQARLY